MAEETPPNAVAIIGMAGRFPGAPSVAQFWQNARGGVDSIAHFAEAELEDMFPDEIRHAENFVRARGIVANPDQFDAGFFGMLPMEAALTDPQHRIFLECAWEAIEDAGYDHARDGDGIGVFAGCSMNTYFLHHVLRDRADIEAFTSQYQVGMYQHLLGALTDTLATRVAYKLNLHGPAATVHTACSTSLFAVAQAWQSLLLHQCDMALAGGVSITLPQKRGYLHLDGGMVSGDGHCRPFDAKASGTVFGNGAGVVLLKRLEDAIDDGDRIYAVLRGCGVNNDGGGKVGFAAPSVNGQADAIAAAHAIAGVEPDSIGYVECHGTATPLGDPIEFEGLLKAFGEGSGTTGGADSGKMSAKGYCALGSGKANIGHLDAAAGVTGLIRAALALHSREIPPLVHFERANPQIDLANSPFYVPTAPTPWESTGGPRRAGVSSFGVGGTNVHAVLEEAPPAARDRAEADAPHRPLILPLSARSETALAAQKAALAGHLEAHPDCGLADAAYTLQAGRHGFNHRTAIVCASRGEAIAALKAEAAPIRSGLAPARPPRIVFMFTGQGAQFVGMGQGLYENEPLFKRHIDQGAELLKPLLGEDIRESLFGDPSSQAARTRLNATRMAQPALFLIEYATARLWMAWGIKPDAMVGHSIGEFAAAALSGTLSFEDALRLVAARGRLMQSQPPGAMLAIRMTEAELRARLGQDLDIAAINAPGLGVASGTFDAIDALEKQLTADGIEGRRLQTSHAFHSQMMDGAVAALTAQAAKVRLDAPALPWISAVSGAPITAAQATSPDYWGRHCRAPVRFADALASAAKGSDAPIVLEIGPGATLVKLAPQILGKQGAAAFIASLPDHTRAKGDAAFIAESLARLWIAGARPDWLAYTGKRRRVSLPTYPFERQRHWIDAPSRARGGMVQPQIAAPPAAPATATTAPVSLPHPEPAITPAAIMVQPSAPPAPLASRKAALTDIIIGQLEALSDEPIAPSDAALTFPELGFDSLLLGQFAQKLQGKTGVKITFRQLLGDIPSIDALADFLDAALPPEAMRPQTPSPVAALAAPQTVMPAAIAFAAPSMTVDGGAGMAQILQTQMQFFTLITQQLQAMQGGAAANAGAAAALIAAPQMSATAAPIAMAAPQAGIAPKPTLAAPAATDGTPSRFQIYRPGGAGRQHREITDGQRAFLADVVARYGAKTARSKAYTAQHRPHLADPRAASGFRMEWKDLVYPLVCPRSKGSKLWDLDGNEYIDLVNGFGQTAFGHVPDFVQDALIAQVKEGFAIGPQSPLAGDVAATIAEMVGAERVTFCNTGSEAVMAAMRVARTVTGRDKVVVFNNDYHGQFDEVLVKAGGRASGPRAVPVAPGIPDESVANMVVLGYGAPESLDWIRVNAGDIAAVIVEPVQSRHPELRPVAFLEELRRITEASGTAFVFDEVVTGFRVHQGGMQALFNIRADMATYGKVLGGGMPVGILAGSSRFMDALDGGQWRYGDDSSPEVAPTFFAGTFVRHPLVLAACKAVLAYLKTEGPGLQERLGARTAQLAGEINADFARRGLPGRAESFSSWFIVNFGTDDRLASIFYPYARLLGVHILEGFPCFLTTAHSEADYVKIASVFREALDAMQGAGILAPNAGSGAAPAAGAGAPSAAQPAGQPREAPLTEPQTEILMAAQLGDEASCSFNESVSLRFDGDIDVLALRGALSDVVARHEALRATIKRGEARLSIAPELALRIPLMDLSAEADPEDALAGLTALDARTAFDLHAGPLVRAQIAKLGAARHVLVFTAHHIVCDGWSMNVILNDLAAFYTARKTGAMPELAPVEPFSAYAEQAARRGTASGDTENYWLRMYDTVPPVAALPLDRARPPVKSFAGDTHTAFVDAGLLKDVRKAGAKQGCTLFATLFAAMQVLFGRLSGESDVVIASPMAGQSLIEDKVLVGHCVNFLPIRLPFDPAKPFADHLQAVKKRMNEAFDHQDYTFGTLVRRLNLPRDPNRTPLTDVQFNLERMGEGLAFPGMTTRFAPNPKAAVNFDLFFNMIESSAGLRIDVDYSTDILDAATIERWIENLRILLRAIAEDASTPITALAIVGAEERRWLLARNTALPPLPKEATIPAAFALSAARFHDSPALLMSDVSISYGHLDGRANRLANLLAAEGLAKGDRVALLATRSIDSVTAILAVLKCGACYVPLDPGFPAERIGFMLTDSDVKLALVQASLLDRPDAINFGPIRRRMIEEVLAAAGEASNAPRECAIDADDPAYIMYTSGSTGRPKGIVATHRGVLRLVTGQSFARFGPDETMLHLAPLPFDASTLELWGALLHGGRLAIVAQAKPSLADIRNAIGAHGVTTAWFTAALFNALVDEDVDTLKPLHQILAGGDVLSPAHVRKAQAALPHCRIVNGYGPTENTTFTCCYAVPDDGWGTGPVPIGMPIARTSVYVLDASGNLAPQGTIGELHAGGEGVARGYLNLPDLTAERFIADPFAPGERLYRTGDLVRWRGDGALEFVGRADGQVKINGFRVETGEIEAVLMASGLLDDAVVVVREGAAGAKMLFGYVTRRKAHQGDDAALMAELQAHAAKLLPKHMLPRGLRVLAAIPRTANDKVDRQALPAFEPAQMTVPAAGPAAPPPPMSDMEARIAAIWAGVLEVPDVGRHQPIFSLGADSLHIFRIAARMAEQGIPLEARHMMRNPTVADLAAIASGETGGASPPPSVQPPSLGSFRRGGPRKTSAAS